MISNSFCDRCRRSTRVVHRVPRVKGSTCTSYARRSRGHHEVCFFSNPSSHLGSACILLHIHFSAVILERAKCFCFLQPLGSFYEFAPIITRGLILWLMFSLFQLSIAGGSNQTRWLQSEDCSACDPLSNTTLSIESVMGAGVKREWRSLPKTSDSVLQEINITIRFPQVCVIICKPRPFLK